MKIAIVKYNAGNIRSVTLCLKRLGVNPILTDNPEELKSSDKIIFPGVGEAGTTMKYLTERKLDKVIQELKQPVLGICLGMQLMCSHSEEGNTMCLNVFNEKVKRFTPAFSKEEGGSPQALKIPHMGWNTLQNVKGNLFDGIPDNEFMYFVHSYYVEQGVNTVAETDYGVAFSSAMQKNNFYGVQFHSEKSAKWGGRIISNFLNIK